MTLRINPRGVYYIYIAKSCDIEVFQNAETKIFVNGQQASFCHVQEATPVQINFGY